MAIKKTLFQVSCVGRDIDRNIVRDGQQPDRQTDRQRDRQTKKDEERKVCLFFRGRICSDNFICVHEAIRTRTIILIRMVNDILQRKVYIMNHRQLASRSEDSVQSLMPPQIIDAYVLVFLEK